MIIHAGGLAALRAPDTGKLRPGVHEASFAALRGYAVTTPHRERIWTAFETWRDRALGHLEPACFWFGGSFITSKPTPNDIDVIAWMPVGKIETMLEAGERPTFELLTLQHIDFKAVGQENISRLDRLQPMGGLVDGFAVSNNLASERSWEYRWSRDWNRKTKSMIPGTEKGIVEVAA